MQLESYISPAGEIDGAKNLGLTAFSLLPIQK